MKRRLRTISKEQGAISLLLVIVLPRLLLVLVIFLNSARMRAYEQQLVRATAAQIESILASYDRDLHRDYGLWGLVPDNWSLDPFWRLADADPSYGGGADIQVSGLKPLSETAVLRQEISRQMKIRAPVTLFQSLYDRVQGLKFGEAGQMISSGTHSIAQTGHLSEARNIVEDAENRRGWASDLTDEIYTYIADKINALYQEIMLGILDIIPEDLTGSASTSITPDYFDAENLSRVGNMLDYFLTVEGETPLDRLYLMEYCMAYFPSHVNIIRRGMESRSLTTPDGRELASLEGRIGELETIITGEFRARSAQLRIDGVI